MTVQSRHEGKCSLRSTYPVDPSAVPNATRTEQSNLLNLTEMIGDWPMARIWLEPIGAVTVGREILNAAVALGDCSATAWAHVIIASGLSVQGTHTEAEPHLDEAMAIFTDLKDEIGQATTILRNDLVWLDREDHSKALDNLFRALELARKHEDRELEGAILNDLGLQFDLSGQPEDAATHLFLALEIANDDDRQWQATLLYNIGYVISNQPDHETAVQWLEEALELSDQIGDFSTAIYAHESLAVSLEHLGCTEMALVHLLEGLNKAEHNNYLRSFASLSLDAGRMLARTDPTSALAHLARSAEVARGLGDDMLMARACLAEWRAAQITGEWSVELLELLQQAVELVERVRPSEQTAILFYDALVDTCRALDRPAEALEYAMLGAERKERYWRRLAESRGVQSTRRHQLDHAEAVAKRERQQRVELTNALRELEAVNKVNEDLVFQLREQAILLERQATEDSLTLLGNRRFFDDQLDREIVRAATFNRPVSVALADVDNFKLINDRYTHRVGDRVLQTLAELFRTDSRETDSIARYGGEEFAFLFPETTLEGSSQRAERLRRSIDSYDWSQIAIGLRVTISIGVVCGEGRVDANHMMASADALLYLAKHRGRNQVRSSAMSDIATEPDLNWRSTTFSSPSQPLPKSLSTDALRRVAI